MTPSWTKSFLALATTAALAEASIIECPQPGASVNLDVTRDNTPVSLSKAVQGVLCALWQTTPTGGLVPVARSYDGNDWEAYPGHFSTLKPYCATAGGIFHASNCTISLPAPAEGAGYELVAFAHSVYSPADEVARFMEKATFGTTRELLDSFEGVPSSDLPQRFAQWVKDQQEMEPTSHRSHYRRRLNGRMDYATSATRATHACEAGTRYRRFAFARADEYKDLTVETAADGIHKVLSVKGQFRTLADGPMRYGRRFNAADTVEDGTYEICRSMNEGMYIDFKLDLPGVGCQTIWFNETFGNPPIALNDNLHPLPEFVMALEGKAEPIAEEFYDDQSNGLEMLQTSIVYEALDDTACSTIGPTAADSTPVFGFYNGLYWIHDPRFFLQENTLENPALDAGGALVKQLGGIVPCSNPPRTFLNEDTCVLSTDPDVCVESKVVCGSPNEDANDPALGAEGSGGGAYDFKGGPSFVSWQHQQKQVVWFHLALHSRDQLIQRMAWALSQIVIITENDLPPNFAEAWMNYYDIFVRNANGNYFDVLKEAMYSEMMSLMLTYRRNLSTQAQWGGQGDNFGYPDENFAREIMQLFSCGLYLLNQDGTQVLDEAGAPIPTYGVSEISEMARVVTGFRESEKRGGIEDSKYIDPMGIDVLARDNHPKLGLLKRYIGEGYPLCTDLPKQHHLKKGATYRLLGYTSKSELQGDHESWVGDNTTVIPSVDISSGRPSELYLALCNPKFANLRSYCNFKSKVVLPDNLVCTGKECDVDSVMTIHVRDGIYYEYVRPPCIHRTFYKNPRKLKGKFLASEYLCGDPLDAIAAPACCAYNRKGSITPSAFRMEKYSGEKVNFWEAEQRCEASADLGMCGSLNVQDCGETACNNNPVYWTKDPCKLQVLVDTNRKVGLVHDAPLEGKEVERGVTAMSLLRNDTKTFFGAVWSNEEAVEALLEDCPSHPSCTVSPDGHCMCSVTVTSEPAFLDIPSVDEVLGLSYGAFHPEITGIVFEAREDSEVTVFYETGKMYSETTVFQVVHPHTRKTILRKNVRSTVSIGGETKLSFKNPVQFMTSWGPELRDAHDETDAFLEMLVQHPSTPPMIGTLLAQRFGISNPSPRYVSEITRAFRTGTYTFNSLDTDISFGSGEYGDLAATGAAILLDREAQNVLVDADPTYGSVREPVIKLLALMRNLEFETHPGAPVVTFQSGLGLQEWIGQMAYSSPSVFSFFLPEFIPRGPLSTAGLRSPESQVQDGQSIVNAINGMSSLIKYGWDSCWNGFGPSSERNCDLKTFGDSTYSSGGMTFWPTHVTWPEHTVDELATLMTSGRLSNASREILKDVYRHAEDAIDAVVKVQTLIVATPEFHATGLTTPTSEARSLPAGPPPSQSGEPYKAVIYVHFNGGMDSFNLLAPHQCSGKNAAGQTVREQYDTERGILALKNSERTSIISATGQPCSEFALHPGFPVLKEMYDSGDLSFFANMGVLNLPAGKSNYTKVTKTQLMAHNAMSREAGRADPFDVDADLGSGVVGRMSRVLSRKSNGLSTSLVSVDSPAVAMDGDEDTPSILVSRNGPRSFDEKPAAEQDFDYRDYVLKLNGGLAPKQSSMFGETWSQNLVRSLADTDDLVNIYASSQIDVSDREGAVLKMIERRVARDVDRDFFYVQFNGWDHHNEMKESFDGRVGEANAFLETVMTELKKMDLWDNVTIVASSDFGRTLVPNANAGSDHAWGGHYFMAGGSVDGGKIHGEYPTDLTLQGPLVVNDRGIMIPTLAWESRWNGVAQWMGVEDQDLSEVLPNKDLTGARLFTKEELFV